MDSTARARSRAAGGNLPAEVTSFVGRRREITLTKRLLAESRVVTLTGPGGIGKSRLALRVAANMSRSFRDKTWQVELGELRDPDLVPATVVEQLNVPETSGGGELDNLVEHFREREALLVLDNCEHLVRACVDLVDTLTRACPGLRVLTTSRQSLGAAGESTLVVPPLQAPDPEQLPAAEAYEQYAAVRLFVDRARAVVPEFEVTPDNAPVLMRLCHRLDGNPLAMELAVVRLRSLSPRQLEERLDERYELLSGGRSGAPPRQQTLRALIDWSYDLCTEPERRAWAHLSVFSGSFDLEAAEYVIDGTTERSHAASLVHALVDKSVLLLERSDGPSRYLLPHTLREYGLEKLWAAGERPEAEARHRHWYTGIAQRFAAEWLGAEQVEWVRRLRAEQANLRAALHSVTEHGDGGETSGEPHAEEAGPVAGGPAVALRLATALGRYWQLRGAHTEARYWLDRTLALTGTRRAPRERAAALAASAWFTLLHGDVAGARGSLDTATATLQGRDAPLERAHLTRTYGMVALFEQDAATAIRLLDDALETFRRGAEKQGELFALIGLGLAHALDGRTRDGLELLEDALAITTGRGEVYWRSWTLWAIGYLKTAEDRLDRAEPALKEALRLQRRLDNRLAIAFSLDTLAWVAHLRGNDRRAARLFGAAGGAWESARSTPNLYATFAEQHRSHLVATREALGDEAYGDAFDRGYHWEHDTAIDFALEVKQRSRETSRENVHPMPLTSREREIAQLVAQGRTNKEIAEQLVIALRTVEGHVQHILTKLDFTSRAQIAGWVAEMRSEQGGQ
ncbi:LuxR family transcriptional regulator [Actinopolyspora erythraea]|uniref:LuxR family transcriptional regulator n=1 Tax=Actinopolyspora erythraea TaxID=414996 RepID=A0A099D762_9ACTN|nr:LuxR C-terminal-related transcriptional regulator [Actinopolyspora erythraea]ASU78268.1 LuxR family transcriptional regulator [Actinopolyspora erythraea]KGI81771.1 LuxR family transcriptional regulator [Actinopolyspora erythraea]